MARPPELKYRVTRNVNFEYQEIKEFEELVGKDNVSKEIRALVHKFLTQQKKGEASPNPLNLVSLSNEAAIMTDNNNNTTLDIYLLSKHDIVKHIDKINDIEVLATIENKGRILHTVARNRKLERIPIEKLKKEMRKS